LTNLTAADDNDLGQWDLNLEVGRLDSDSGSASEVAPAASKVAELAAIIMATNVQVFTSSPATKSTFIDAFPLLRFGPWLSSRASRLQNGNNQAAMTLHKTAVQDNIFDNLQGVDIRGASDWAMCYTTRALPWVSWRRKLP